VGAGAAAAASVMSLSVDVLEGRALLEQLVGLLDLAIDDGLEGRGGCAPTSWFPLMKNVGVPFAPAAVPTLESWSTSALILGSSQSFLKRAMLRPAASAYFSMSARASAVLFS